MLTPSRARRYVLRISLRRAARYDTLSVRQRNKKPTRGRTMAALEVEVRHSAAMVEARRQLIMRLSNALYELAAALSDHEERRLLIEIDDAITDLWSLHEVIDG